MQKFERNIAIKYSLQLGDFWYACAGIKQTCELLQCKADLYLGVDKIGLYQKELKDDKGEVIHERQEKIMLSRTMYDMALPLIQAQEWCGSVQEYADQKIDLDLDITMKSDVDVNMPFGHIPRWFFQVFPYMNCDLSKPWLTAEVDDTFPAHSLVVNRSARFHNEGGISYNFLNLYKDRMFFIGLPDEHVDFQNEFQVRIPRIEVTDFRQLAKIINSCHCFLGNQSMCFALAEALKVPRVLEVCRYAPNVIPEGPGAHDFLFQHGLEYHVKTLMKLPENGYRNDPYSQIE